MKVLSLFFIFFASNTAVFAKPLPPEMKGSYLFQNEMQVGDAKNTKVVYVSTESGKAQYRELLKENYTCEAKGREIYLCYKFLHNITSSRSC